MSMSMRSHSKRRISYFYDTNIGNYYYGPGHPMKPHRVRMTHNLILNYGLYRKMEIFHPIPASDFEMTRFHSDDYIRFLKSVNLNNIDRYEKETAKFNVVDDCPVFEGFFEFCQKSAGGSIASAIRLNKQKANICINWSGGLHHAKKSEASGFCYVNDIVLGILELLKYHQRVLYIDIDVHHGDGVEEAFYTTDRVMTVSFHKFGKFFPGTGSLNDIGAGKGKHYSLNVPLRDGMDDNSYESMFVPIMGKVMETFRPSAVVLQCGADSLSGDRLGCFNLSIKGHGKCVEFIKSYNLPLMILGGGGYTIKNVSRCWAYETSIALGIDIPNEIPYNDFFDYFGPDFKLHFSTTNMRNYNTKEYLGNMRTKILESLRELSHAPSVQVQAIPEDAMDVDNDDRRDKAKDSEAGKDKRATKDEIYEKIEPDNEFYDHENDSDYKKLQAITDFDERMSLIIAKPELSLLVIAKAFEREREEFEAAQLEAAKKLEGAAERDEETYEQILRTD